MLSCVRNHVISPVTNGYFLILFLLPTFLFSSFLAPFHPSHSLFILLFLRYKLCSNLCNSYSDIPLWAIVLLLCHMLYYYPSQVFSFTVSLDFFRMTYISHLTPQSETFQKRKFRSFHWSESFTTEFAWIPRVLYPHDLLPQHSFYVISPSASAKI